MFNHLSRGFSNAFNITGRATRSEFWFFTLEWFIVWFFIALLCINMMFLALLFLCILYVPMTSITVRRFNDAGSNIGFLLLLSIFQIFLPFLFIVYFYFLCKESSESNKEKIKANVWHRIAFILLSSPPFFGMIVAKHLGII